MDIIRRILLNVEEDKYPYGARINLEDVPDEVCAYHVALILEAGLADGEVLKSTSSPNAAAFIHRLTTAGHDFCDGIRNDTIWNKTKEHILKPGASYTLSVVIEYVKMQVHRRVFGNQ